MKPHPVGTRLTGATAGPGEGAIQGREPAERYLGCCFLCPPVSRPHSCHLNPFVIKGKAGRQREMGLKATLNSLAPSVTISLGHEEKNNSNCGLSKRSSCFSPTKAQGGIWGWSDISWHQRPRCLLSWYAFVCGLDLMVQSGGFVFQASGW